MTRRKVIINFHLEQEIVDEIKKILKNPYSTFENQAQLIRYCIKQQMPAIKKELEENR